MQKDFNSDNGSLATFAMTVYVLEFGVGPPLVSPLSEVYVRMVIYRYCIIVWLHCRLRPLYKPEHPDCMWLPIHRGLLGPPRLLQLVVP